MSTPTTPATRPAIWAESGTTVEPDTGSQQSGFIAGKPGRGMTNWLLNWIDNCVQWLLLRGLPTYNSAATYATGARVQTTDGVSWKAIVDGLTGVTPGSDTTKWVLWGFSDSDIPVSGPLAGGTITSSTANDILGYCRQVLFPRSTDKLVFCRLRIANTIDGYGSVLTLSGAAAFAVGIDGAQLVLANTDYSTATDVRLIAKVLSPTTVQILAGGIVGSETYLAFDVEVWIRGH